MQIPKPSESDKQAFIEAMAPFEGAIVKPMFGNLGAFVNGNMFAGLFGSDLGVRLTEASDFDELARVPGSGPYGPAERPMTNYRSLPSDWPERRDLVSEWVGRAFDQVLVLTPKPDKARKR
jgi:TfoX/Sxy family transcriptional regulator of competence genes